MKGKVAIVPHHISVKIRWMDPAELYTLMVGPGWVKIMLDLTEKLFALGWDGQLADVKEKYGTLRFDWISNITGIIGEIAEDVVAHAEHATGYACQTCGDYAETSGEFWRVTLCEKHLEKSK